MGRAAQNQNDQVLIKCHCLIAGSGLERLGNGDPLRLGWSQAEVPLMNRPHAQLKASRGHMTSGLCSPEHLALKHGCAR